MLIHNGFNLIEVHDNETVYDQFILRGIAGSVAGICTTCVTLAQL